MVRLPPVIRELRLGELVLRRGLEQRRRRNLPLWSSASEFDEAWKARIALMARYVDRPGAVADFGCGPMWLEEFLPPGNTYVPIDYIPRDDRTIVLDLNADPLPDLHAQVAVMSGVLEYVRDLEPLVSQLEQQGFTRLIVSYNTVDRVPRLIVRKAFNWVSHLHLDELLTLFYRGFTLVEIDSLSSNTILVFEARQSPRSPSTL
jgi:hypothetical protein